MERKKKNDLKKEKEYDINNTEEEESKPLLEPEHIKNKSTTVNKDNEINDDNEDSINNNTKSELANERRKNKGFESNNSIILHYLFIIYYYIKLFFNFIYMFFHSLISVSIKII